MQSAIYAHKGLKSQGCDSVKIFGNLAVETLNREKMPEEFFCRLIIILKIIWWIIFMVISPMITHIIANWMVIVTPRFFLR